jgi:hypothetical protein
MTAFGSAIRNQSRASVAAMQELAGDFTANCRSNCVAFRRVRKKTSGPRRVPLRAVLGSFAGFNRMATCGMIVALKPFDAR